MGHLVHRDPVWRGRADTLLQMPVPDSPGDFEQLWARHVAGLVYEVCCIPFFVYDVALVDHVAVVPGSYRVDRVVVAPDARCSA